MNAAWLRVELWLVFSVMLLFNIATFTQQEVSCYSMCWYSCTTDKTQDLLSVMTNCKITLMEHLCKNVYNPTAILLQILSFLLAFLLSFLVSFFLSCFRACLLFLSIIICIAFSFFVPYCCIVLVSYRFYITVSFLDCFITLYYSL